MALENLLSISADHKKIGISIERLQPVMPALRKYIAFFRWYPDIFVDFMSTGFDKTIKSTFSLFFYQRVFLRVAIRYKYVYAVFPRASMAPTGIISWTNFFN